jgi:hypothetical protein
MRSLWRIWAKALGEKSEEHADASQAIVTNVLISINIIINWL